MRFGLALLVVLVGMVPAHALRLHPFGTGLPATGQWRDGFDVADVDGDGQRDLVHGPPRKGGGPPVIFLGDGKGGWRRWDAARFPAVGYDYGDTRAADVDGDGALDLVLAMHLRGVVVLRGDGHGGFSPGAPLPGGTDGFSSRAVQVADWNGDGRPDILALGEGPRPGEVRATAGKSTPPAAVGLRIWLGQSDGWTLRDDGGSPLFGRTVALGDVDGDGRRELVTGSNVLGRTDLLCVLAASGGCTRSAIDALPARAYVRAVAAGDLNGDGRDELVVAATGFDAQGPVSTIDVVGQGRDGVWKRTRVTERRGLVGAWTLAVGDLDGDGARDLVALSQRGDIWVYRNDGRGTLRAEPDAAEFPGGCGGSHVALVDLNGDGRDEIVAAFATEPRPDEPEVCPDGGGLMAWTTRGN